MFEFSSVQFLNILDIPSLHIAEGRVTSLTGPSGSGKTTILKMLNRMLSPTAGQILFNGKSLDHIDPVAHRRSVTMLSQSPVMFEGNIRDNLTAGLRFQKRLVPQDNELKEMLARVRLGMELDSDAQTLSGGEKQRLALARVMLLHSAVYLLDEPSSALDDATAETVIEMFAEYVRNENRTLVMVTHSKAIAQRFSDEGIEMARVNRIGGLHERDH